MSDSAMPAPHDDRQTEQQDAQNGFYAEPLAVAAPPPVQPPLAGPSLWQRLWSLLFGGISAGDLTARVAQLDRAVEQYPDAPVNYVLRAEYLYDMGAYESALADFEQALTLASAQFEHDNWGLISQAMQDRALRGRKLTLKRLQRGRK